MQHTVLLHNHERNDNDNNAVAVTVGRVGAMDIVLAAMWWRTVDQKAAMQHECNRKPLLRER